MLPIQWMMIALAQLPIPTPEDASKWTLAWAFAVGIVALAFVLRLFFWRSEKLIDQREAGRVEEIQRLRTELAAANGEVARLERVAFDAEIARRQLAEEALKASHAWGLVVQELHERAKRPAGDGDLK